MKTSNTIKNLLTILGVCLLGAACSFLSRETVPPGAGVRDAKNRYREQYAQLRPRLAEVSRRLPPVGSISSPSESAGTRGQRATPSPSPSPANLNPPPTSENTGLIAAEQLLDPGRQPSSSSYSPPDFFEIDTQDCPAECFRLLARGNPDMPDVIDRDGAVARRLEAGLAHRYLAVYRAVSYSPPRVMSSEDQRILGQPGDGRSRFSPGHVDLEVFVFDLQSNEIVASFRTVHSSSAQTVTNLATLESEMRASAREGIFAGLTRTTGGTFNSSNRNTNAP